MREDRLNIAQLDLPEQQVFRNLLLTLGNEEHIFTGPNGEGFCGFSQENEFYESSEKNGEAALMRVIGPLVWDKPETRIRSGDPYFVYTSGQYKGKSFIYGGWGCSMQSACCCLYVSSVDKEFWESEFEVLKNEAELQKKYFDEMMVFNHLVS